jgi:hypothetical protein
MSYITKHKCHTSFLVLVKRRGEMVVNRPDIWKSHTYLGFSNIQTSFISLCHADLGNADGPFQSVRVSVVMLLTLVLTLR